MDISEKKILDNAKEWLASKEGRRSLKNSIQEAIKRSKKFNESRQIDPKILKETFTI